MRKLFAVLAGLFVIAGAGCSSRPVLNVYTWADYIKPELLKRFEQEHGCRVVIDTFDSNEAIYTRVWDAIKAAE